MIGKRRTGLIESSVVPYGVAWNRDLTEPDYLLPRGPSRHLSNGKSAHDCWRRQARARARERHHRGCGSNRSAPVYTSVWIGLLSAPPMRCTARRHRASDQAKRNAHPDGTQGSGLEPGCFHDAQYCRSRAGHSARMRQPVASRPAITSRLMMVSQRCSVRFGERGVGVNVDLPGPRFQAP